MIIRSNYKLHRVGNVGRFTIVSQEELDLALEWDPFLEQDFAIDKLEGAVDRSSRCRDVRNLIGAQELGTGKGVPVQRVTR